MPGRRLVSGGLGGESERELGRQLAGQCVADGIERGAGVARQASRQMTQPVVPRRPPVRLVARGQVRQNGIGPRQVTGDDAGAGQRQARLRRRPHLRRYPLLPGGGRGKRLVALGRVQRAQRGEVAGRGVGRVDLRYREHRHDLLRGRRRMGGRGTGGSGAVGLAGEAGLGSDRVQLGAEQGRERRPGLAVGYREHLPQDPGQLLGHVARRGEPAVRVGIGRAPQHPEERFLLGQQRHRGRVRQAVGIPALVARELEGEHGEGPAHGVEVGGRRGPQGRDLRRLVPGRPVDGAVLIVDAPHAAHVDELELLLGLDHVVRLEIAVHEPPAVQVPERGQHLDRVGERHGQRQRLARLAPLQQDLPERLSADVFHDDVSGRLPRRAVGVLHEVIDPDDARMLDLRQEPALGDGRLLGRGVAGVEQALEHNPAPAQVMVHGQVDPAEPAVRQAAEHLVLARDQLAGLQLRGEREPAAAVGAEPLDEPWPSVPAASDRTVARAAESLALSHQRVRQHRGRGVPGGHGRDLHQPGTQVSPGRPAAARARAAATSATAPGAAARGRRACGGRRASRTGRPWLGRHRLGRHRLGRHRLGRPRLGRHRGQPATVAVPALDRPAAAGSGTRGRDGRHGRSPRPLSARTACW